MTIFIGELFNNFGILFFKAKRTIILQPLGYSKYNL